jgi:hypothetical protein
MASEWEDEDVGLDGFDFWRLCDELTVVQAALLIAGCDPSRAQDYVERWVPEKRPKGYDAAKTAIANVLRRGGIEGDLAPEYEYDINQNIIGEIAGSVDLHRSRVVVNSLRNWLFVRGFRVGFFFPLASGAPDYLDPANPRYAPKLAAAVRAWQGVTDPGGKHPKQALVKWLREHAAEFGLSDSEGKPNETGIDEVAKVANWQPAGGAPRTPGE